MKANNISRFLSLSLAITLFAACDDEDSYTIYRTPLINSVQTGEATVTAVSASLSGAVNGSLEGQSSSAYTVGVLYAPAPADPISSGSSVEGSYADGSITATVDGLVTGVTYNYCAYLTLQGLKTYYGDVRTFTTTASALQTVDAVMLSGSQARLQVAASGVSNLSSDVEGGFYIGATSEANVLKTGKQYVGEWNDSKTLCSLDAPALLPGKTYYYMPYIDLGSSTEYGDVKSFTTAEASVTWVDLGLSVCWAESNLGAASAEAVGACIGYGDLTGVENATDASAYYQGGDIAGTSYDPVLASGYGMMPTTEQYQELIHSCTSSWTTQNGVEGMLFTGPNGNTLFFPAATGYWTGSDSATLYTEYATSVTMGTSGAGIGTSKLSSHLAIRPVENPAQGYKTKLTLYDGSDEGWNSFTAILAKDAIGQQLCISANVTRTQGAVYVLDIEKLVNDYPNAFVSLDRIEIDGNNVPFDANKLHYGDLEGKGNYRIEIYNIWGSGTASDSPFEGAQGDLWGSPTALALAIQNEIKVYITLRTLDLKATYTQYDANDANWTAEEVNMPVTQLPQDFTVTLEGTRRGGAVAFLQIDGGKDLFPNMSLVLKEVKCDGVVVPFEASKVLYGDLENKGNYRVELYNCWGNTANASPWGETGMLDSWCQTALQLAFSTQIEVTYTVEKLF